MSTYPSSISVSGGTWGSYTYDFVSETGTQFLYRTPYDPPNSTTPNAGTSRDIYFDTSDNKWYDGDTGGAPSGFWNQTADPNGTNAGDPSVACSANDTIKLTDGGASGNRGSFTQPTITSASVTPQTLPSVDSTSTWASTYEYRWQSSTSTTEIYGLWHISNGVWDSATHNIQVNTDSTSNQFNTWQDSGSSHPDSVSAPSNGVITVSSSGFPNLFKFNKPTTASWISSGGSGSGSGSGGGINTLSGGSSPEIKDITFTNASDTIVYLAFNWQNVSTAYLFVDRGGTVTQTNISLGGLGQSGSVGSSGFLTNMQDGDKIWIANTELVNNPHIHRFIDWSYDKATGKVTAKAFFIDDGGNGFNQNADVALARIFGATYNHGYSLYEAQQDPTGGFTDHDGTLKTLTLDAPPGSRWAITRGNTHQYGTGFKVPSANRKVFCNFW